MRKDWVEALAETRLVRQSSAFDRIEYNRVKVPWPLHDRDFVYRAQVKADRKAKILLISMKSVEDPAEPPKGGVVRANILHSYYFLKDVSDPGENKDSRHS